MTVFDALMNEGAAKRDGLDQQAIVKLVFEGSLRIREGTVVPDLSLEKFKFTPPAPTSPLISSFQTPTGLRVSTSQGVRQDRPVPSIESNINHHPRSKRQGFGRGSPMAIQDSQVVLEDVGEKATEPRHSQEEEEPKAESPELARGPYSFPLPQSGDNPPLENEPVPESDQIPSTAIRIFSQESERLISPSVLHPHAKAGPSQHSPLTDARSLSKRVSSAPGLSHQDKAGKRQKNSAPITPPSDSARDTAFGTKSTNSKLSRPSCRISPARPLSLSDQHFPQKPRSGNNVYDVPESEIEDSQNGLELPPAKKRKLVDSGHNSPTSVRSSERIDSRSASQVGDRIRQPLANNAFSDRRIEKLNEILPLSDRDLPLNASGSKESSEEGGSVSSEAVTGQDEIDQQLRDSTNAAAIDRQDLDESLDSNDVGEAETLIYEDVEGGVKSIRGDQRSFVQDSGPKYAGDSAHDHDSEFKDFGRHNPDSDSEKENLNFRVERGAGLSYHDQDSAHGSQSPSNSAGENVAAVNYIGNNLDTVPQLAPDLLPVKQRTALGILKSISLERGSHAESDDMDREKSYPKQDVKKDVDREFEDAASTADNSSIEDKKDLEGPNKRQENSQLPDLTNDATSAECLKSKTEPSKSTLSAATSQIPRRQSQSADANDFVDELQRKGNVVTKKRKRHLMQEKALALNESEIADTTTTNAIDHASDDAENAAKRPKKAQKTTLNGVDVKGVAENGSRLLKPTSSSIRSKKKTPPGVKGGQISNSEGTSSSKADRLPNKKKKISASNADVLSADIAHEPKTTTKKQLSADSGDSGDSVFKESGNTRRIGLGITSSPSHHRTKPSDLSITTSEPATSAQSRPKKKSSTTPIPGGKSSEILELKNALSSRTVLENNSTGASSDDEVLESDSIGRDDSSKTGTSKNQLQRVDTASPAPIIPNGMSEETWRKLVSKNADNPSAPVQSRKRTSQRLEREVCRDDTANQTKQVNERGSNANVKAMATAKKRDGTEKLMKARSSPSLMTLELGDKAKQSTEPPAKSSEGAKTSNSRKNAKKIVSKDNGSVLKGKAKSSIKPRTEDRDQSDPSNEKDQKALAPTKKRRDEKTETQIMPNVTTTATRMNQARPSDKSELSHRGQSDSEIEPEDNGSEISEASKNPARADGKFARLNVESENNSGSFKDNTKARRTGKKPTADRENSGIKASAVDISSAAPRISRNKNSTISATTPSSGKGKPADTVGYPRPSPSFNVHQPASEAAPKAPTSRKAADVKEAHRAIHATNAPPMLRSDNAKTERPQQSGGNRLAAMRRKQEEEKAAAQVAARKAEAERQRARLINAQHSTISSSSDSSDSSDDSESDSDAGPPKRLSGTGSSSAQSSYAHSEQNGAAAGLKQPLKAPVSMSTNQAGKEASLDSVSDDSDDNTEVMKRDRTPPPKRGAPKGLLEGIKKALAGVR